VDARTWPIIPGPASYVPSRRGRSRHADRLIARVTGRRRVSRCYHEFRVLARSAICIRQLLATTALMDAAMVIVGRSMRQEIGINILEFPFDRSCEIR